MKFCLNRERGVCFEAEGFLKKKLYQTSILDKKKEKKTVAGSFVWLDKLEMRQMRLCISFFSFREMNI